MTNNSTVVELLSVNKTYVTGKIKVHAVKDVSLKIERGEFVTYAGPSGSGKTTLLNLTGGLDVPDSGEIIVDGVKLSQLSQSKLSILRRDHIGFVFQAYNLIPVLTVKENIEYVMLLKGVDPMARSQRVSEILKSVDLEGMEKRFPRELSGGQQQRVAVGRAIASRPSIILADEPTANLDSASSENLIEIMRNLNKENGITFIFSTHDPSVMEKAKRIITIKDGRVDDDTYA